MDFNRFTEKMQEAVRAAQSIAAQHGNQQIEVEHLLLALLQQEGGLAPSILNKADIKVDSLRTRVQQEIDRLPKVSGPAGAPDQVYVTQRLTKLVSQAEEEAKRLKDEFTSVEHVLLALTDDSGPAGKLFREFGVTRDRLMRALQEELDDPDPADCGRCAVCTAPRFGEPPGAELIEQAGRHLRSRPIELEVKKMAPDADGAMRKIPDGVRIDPGWSLARFGDGGWWPAVERGLQSGEFEPDVVSALAEVLRGGAEAVRWVTSVPSVRLGGVLARLGERLAAELGVGYVELLERVADRPPQREMANAVSQAANVRGAFRVVGSPPPGVGVLLDDRRSSGWTLAMVGGQLRRAGAERVVPLALGALG